METNNIGQDKSVGCILIVDDLPNWREVLTSVLLEDGHTVYSAADPSQALDLLAKVPVDVAILDMRLQDKDMYDVRGIRLLEDIRATSPGTCIVMITGFPSNGFLGKINSTYNVDAFWLKNPAEYRFDIEAFSQEIRALVNKSRQCKRQT
jgi:DNA-binding NtrC family response regulator